MNILNLQSIRPFNRSYFIHELREVAIKVNLIYGVV